MTPDDEPNSPTPPRYRWLRRLAIAYVILAAAMLSLWFVWNAYASRSLDAEVTRLQSLGQYVTTDDFNNRPDFPDEKNAASFFEAAFAGLAGKPFTAAQDAVDSHIDFSIPFDAATRQTLRSFATTYASEFDLARKARGATAVRWHAQFASPIIVTPAMVTAFNDGRHLAHILAYAARGEHADGADDVAIEHIRDLLYEGEVMDSDVTSALQHLVGIGMAAMASYVAQDAASDLRIGGQGGASPEQVRGLIAELLDNRLNGAGFKDAIHAEQAFQLAAARKLPTAGPGRFGAAPQVPRPLMPVIRLSAVRSTRQLSKNLAGFDANSYLKSQAAWVDDPGWTHSIATNVVNVVERTIGGSLKRMIQTQFRVVIVRRAAATLLALRWYQIDHAGQLPQTLAELVPKYLPAVPGDPYSPTGQPLGYLPSTTIDGVTCPAVYSVFEDGTDNHGSTKPTERLYRSGNFRHDPYGREDLVFPLCTPYAATLAAPPPTTLPDADQN